MAKLRTYNVTGELKLSVSVDVRAATMEEVLTQARALKTTDFVTIDGEFLDGGLERISSIYEPDQ